jgi:hypothetical protein
MAGWRESVIEKHAIILRSLLNGSHGNWRHLNSNPANDISIIGRHRQPTPFQSAF